MTLSSAPGLNFNEDLTPNITFEKPHIWGLGRNKLPDESQSKN